MLADDLRARTDPAVHGDQHCVRFFPQGVAPEQAIGRGASADQVTRVEPPLGDDREGVLEAANPASARP